MIKGTDGCGFDALEVVGMCYLSIYMNAITDKEIDIEIDILWEKSMKVRMYESIDGFIMPMILLFMSWVLTLPSILMQEL